MSEKQQRLEEFCERNGCTGVVLQRRANIAWLTDGAEVGVDLAAERGQAALIWSRKRRMAVVAQHAAERLRREELDSDWEIVTGPWWEPPELPRARYIHDWPTDQIAPLRSPLTAGEIKRVTALGREAADAVAAVMIDVTPGASELALAAAITHSLLKRGIMTRVLRIASDDRATELGLAPPTHGLITRFACASVAAERFGLLVSLTRCVHFGPPPTDLSEKCERVRSVLTSFLNSTRPGARLCDVFSAGVEALATHGMADAWRAHPQGGTTGYVWREVLASPSATQQLLAGQLVAWSPTVPGATAEETLIVGKGVITSSANWPTRDGIAETLIR